MKRHLIFILTLFLAFSCRERKEKFNQEAIELNNRAVKFMANVEYDSALILLDKATKLDSNYYLAYANKVTTYLEIRNFNKALEELEKELKIKPKLAEGWSLAGILYYEKGDTIKALNCFEKSIELFEVRIANPDNKKYLTENRLNRAVSLILIGRENEGRDELNKLKEENLKNLAIDEFQKMSRQDFLRKIFEPR